MKYTLEIFSIGLITITKKSHTRSFENIHDMCLYLVNISDGVAIEFNSRDSEQNSYLVYDGTRNTANNKNYISLLSDQSLLDFCLEKYSGNMTINGRAKNYFNTGAGKYWQSNRKQVFNEILYRKNKRCLEKLASNQSHKLYPVPKLPPCRMLKRSF